MNVTTEYGDGKQHQAGSLLSTSDSNLRTGMNNIYVDTDKREMHFIVNGDGINDGE